MEGDLGHNPMLPQGLTFFRAEGMAKGWDDAPGPYTPVPKDSPLLPPKAPAPPHPYRWSQT